MAPAEMAARKERGRSAVKWLIYSQIVGSQRELAELMHYNVTVVSAILNGRTPFSDKFGRNLCRLHPRLSLQWLLTGEGEMLLPPTAVGAMPVHGRGEHDASWQGTARHATPAPLYPDLQVSAGANEQFDATPRHETVCIPGVHAEAFFPVSGHSMEPYIHEGDFVGVVRVDRLEGINPDKIYMLETRSGERMVKHILPCPTDDNLLTLVSDNAAVCPAFQISREEVVRIMRVVFSGRIYR